MVKTIHVVFKTHLDIGFTGLGADVLANYRDAFIPSAIDLAERARLSGHDISFIWTTGSWLIKHALEEGTPAQRIALEAAIRRGDIAWHALPVSTHTELMDAELVDYGISISESLDAQFGRVTTAAKMTDVPGHTIGLVPILARHGIRYLHIGTNPASAVPAVPNAFIWQAPDGSRVVVNYDSDYGAAQAGRVQEIAGCDSALYIAHTNDNHGPQRVDDVIELFEMLRTNYPGAVIRASTFDAFAADLVAVSDQLPVVTEEIGDTWIHGPASDPLHTARYRALLGLRRRWVDDGTMVRGSAEYNGFSDPLLLIAEHTWGKDVKSFLPDFVDYERTDFARARAVDRIEPRRIPEELTYLAHFTDRPPAGGYTFSALEESWAEQRSYIERAVNALTAPLQREARDALSAVEAPLEALDLTGADLASTHRLGTFDVRFGDDGAIISLVDASGRQWAGLDHPIGAFWHETFGQTDFSFWLNHYTRDLEVTKDWAVPDFSKPGMQSAVPAPRRESFVPRVTALELGRCGEQDVAQVRLALPDESTTRFGAPATVILRYQFDQEGPAIGIQLRLADRTASRLPEASWLTINPIVTDPTGWRMSKLGTDVSPLDVVRNGNRNLHAVDAVRYDDDAITATIETEDAPVVAVGRPRILEFDNQYGDLANGFHLNLHNNIWGTNFRMWFDDDVVYRVRLSLVSG